MKKYSDDPIPQIVILGDGKYEFCFNHQQQQEDDKISYYCDIVYVWGTPDKTNIKQALVADGKSDQEADELLKDLQI